MTQSRTIRLATRGSDLALWQARRIAELLAFKQPGLDIELVIISTKPDRIQDRPLHELGGDKGLFVKEVEQAILDGRADAAVHSLKDVPVEETTPGLRLVAFPERANPRDVLLSRTGLALQALPAGATVATGAPRRQAQLLALRPDLKVCGVRGNVDNRVRKLHAGEFDAIIMAAAGLGRLGMDHHITEELSLECFVPAPGQGIVTVQAPDISHWADLWAAIDNPQVRLQAEVERELSLRIGATCHTAAGCYLSVTGDTAHLSAVVLSPDGTTRITANRQAPLAAASTLASDVADELLEQGCRGLMKS